MKRHTVLYTSEGRADALLRVYRQMLSRVTGVNLSSEKNWAVAVRSVLDKAHEKEVSDQTALPYTLDRGRIDGTVDSLWGFFSDPRKDHRKVGVWFLANEHVWDDIRPEESRFKPKDWIVQGYPQMMVYVWSTRSITDQSSEYSREYTADFGNWSRLMQTRRLRESEPSDSFYPTRVLETKDGQTMERSLEDCACKESWMDRSYASMIKTPRGHGNQARFDTRIEWVLWALTTAKNYTLRRGKPTPELS